MEIPVRFFCYSLVTSSCETIGCCNCKKSFARYGTVNKIYQWENVLLAPMGGSPTRHGRHKTGSAVHVWLIVWLSQYTVKTIEPFYTKMHNKISFCFYIFVLGELANLTALRRTGIYMDPPLVNFDGRCPIRSTHSVHHMMTAPPTLQAGQIQAMRLLSGPEISMSHLKST